jgi:hypothetical protein
MMDGRLQAFNLTIQRGRIRDSLRRVSGMEIRKRRRLTRRKYKVRAPLSLVHIDGYMKLIR